MATQSPPPNPSSRRTWIIGVIAGCISLFLALVVCGGIGLIWLSRVVTTSPTFTTALATASARTTPGTASATPLYDAQADAQADIADALSQAADEEKLVLIDFGADCVVLSSSYGEAGYDGPARLC